MTKSQNTKMLLLACLFLSSEKARLRVLEKLQILPVSPPPRSSVCFLVVSYPLPTSSSINGREENFHDGQKLQRHVQVIKHLEPVSTSSSGNNNSNSQG